MSSFVNAGFKQCKTTDNKLYVTLPSEMLESWNIVSKAWWISANEGLSNGLHCQPGREVDMLLNDNTEIRLYKTEIIFQTIVRKSV